MSKSRKKIVSTKLLNNVQLQRLEKYFDVSHFDVIKAEPFQVNLSGVSENVILTSFKAAQIAIDLLGHDAANKKYYCVGQKITQLLTDLKLELVHSELYSKELANWIVENQPNVSYSYLCSKQRLVDLPVILGNAGVQFEEVFTYESKVSNWSAHSVDLKEADLFLWFSPMGVEAMKSLHASIEGKKHYCIGATTAKSVKAIAKLDSGTVYHPEVPSVDGMIEMIIKKNI